MARPTIDHLFDTRVLILRQVESLGPRREAVYTWTPVPVLDGLNACVNRPTARLGDPGPGLTPIGERVLYLRPDQDVRPTDLVQIVGGPDAGTTWEVDQPPTRPRGHHTELRCRHWSGTLPAEVS